MKVLDSNSNWKDGEPPVAYPVDQVSVISLNPAFVPQNIWREFHDAIIYAIAFLFDRAPLLLRIIERHASSSDDLLFIIDFLQ
jgi:hypothetical protein